MDRSIHGFFQNAPQETRLCHYNFSGNPNPVEKRYATFFALEDGVNVVDSS